MENKTISPHDESTLKSHEGFNKNNQYLSMSKTYRRFRFLFYSFIWGSLDFPFSR